MAVFERPRIGFECDLSVRIERERALCLRNERLNLHGGEQAGCTAAEEDGAAAAASAVRMLHTLARELDLGLQRGDIALAQTEHAGVRVEVTVVALGVAERDM